MFLLAFGRRSILQISWCRYVELAAKYFLKSGPEFLVEESVDYRVTGRVEVSQEKNQTLHRLWEHTVGTQRYQNGNDKKRKPTD